MANRYDNIDKNFLCGLTCGILPVVFASIAFGDGMRVISWICLAAFGTVMLFLLQSSTINDHKQKWIISAVCYVIMLFISNVINLPGNVFAMMNPEYVRDFGGPNAGDGLGMVFVIMPMSFQLLIVTITIAGIISKEREKRHSDDTDK